MKITSELDINKVSRFADSNRKLTYPIILLIISLVTHWSWFQPGFVSESGDINFLPEGIYRHVGAILTGTWQQSGLLGAPNPQMYHDTYYFIWQMFACLHIGFAACYQITFFIPVAILSFIAPYLLIKSLTLSSHGAFIGAAIYGMNCAVLCYEQSEIVLALGFSLLPLVVHYFIKWISSKKWRALFVFILVLNLNIAVECRTAFLACFSCLALSVFYFGMDLRLFPKLRQLAVGFAAVLLTNLFWIISQLTSARSQVSYLGSRTVFGSGFTNFNHALTTAAGSWLADGKIFTMTVIPNALWGLPMLAILSIYFANEGGLISATRLKLYSLFLITFGVFCAKGINPPLPNFFIWVREFVPGFFQFRDGPYIGIFTTLGYSILIGLLFKCKMNHISITRKLFFKISISALVIAVVGVNVGPMITGNIGGLFNKRTEPMGAVKLDKYLGNQPGFSQILWFPYVPNFFAASLNHPSSAVGNVLSEIDQQFVNNSSYKNNPTNFFDELSNPNVQDKLTSLLFKYVVMAPNEQNSYSEDIGPETYKGYIDYLKSQKWLVEVKNFGNGYVLFRNLLEKNQSFGSQQFMYENSSKIIGVVRPSIPNKNFAELPIGFNSYWTVYAIPASQFRNNCPITQYNYNQCSVNSYEQIFHKKPSIKVMKMKTQESDLGTVNVLMDGRTTPGSQYIFLAQYGDLSVIQKFFDVALVMNSLIALSLWGEFLIRKKLLPRKL